MSFGGLGENAGRGVLRPKKGAGIGAEFSACAYERFYSENFNRQGTRSSQNGCSTSAALLPDPGERQPGNEGL
jgi:hypothetical protein